MNKYNFIITVAMLSMLASGFTYAIPLTATPPGAFNVPPYPPGPYVDASLPSPIIGGFTQTWSSPADSNWWGTFTATGPLTSSGFSGPTTFDFTSLALGFLPKGTAFVFGDIDCGDAAVGCTDEQIDLSATGTGPLTNWLGAPTVDWMGSADSNDAACAGNSTCLPSYSLAGGTYSFYGAGVTNTTNPTLAFILLSNADITTLTVTKAHVNNGFGLRAPPRGAPIPEPTSLALLALGFASLGFSRSQIGLAKSKALLNETA